MERIPDATKNVWLPLLEGGELKQAVGALRSGLGYCCLGVYALACGATFTKEDDEVDDEGNITNEVDDYIVDVDGDDVNDNELLDERFAEKHGIHIGQQTFLSHLNDGGECVVRNDDPLFALYEKHGTEVTGPHAATAGNIKFNMKRRTFAEIAQIIREDL